MGHSKLIWFKRDRRVQDHEVLDEASRAGPVVPVCVYEPGQLAAPTHDASPLDSVNCDDPRPIVDETVAMRVARDRVGAVRRQTKARSESQAVYRKQGSRRRPLRRRARG